MITLPEHVKQTIGECIGEASMCWETPPTGIFDMERASKIAARLEAAFAEAKADELNTRMEKLEKVAEAAREYNTRLQISCGNQIGKNTFDVITSRLNMALAELGELKELDK